MKIPFKRDTAAVRRQVLEQTSQAAAQLAQLRASRQAALIEADDVDAVKRIDDEIAALERAVRIHQDRLRALAEQLKTERGDQREFDRQAAIKAIEKKLARREVLATELEAAIKTVEECYFALIEFPSITGDWPFAMTPGFGRIDLRGIQKEVAWAIYSAGRPVGGRSRLPAGESLDLGVSGIKPESISGLVARENRQIIESLQIAYLGRDDDSEAA
jgi:hypothetical protein